VNSTPATPQVGCYFGALNANRVHAALAMDNGRTHSWLPRLVPGWFEAMPVYWPRPGTAVDPLQQLIVSYSNTLLESGDFG